MEAGKERRKREFTGIVKGLPGIKTVKVEVSKRMLHRVYHKYITRTVCYLAHDEGTVCSVGDRVVIEESRPLSARKRWRVLKTLNKVPGALA